jgi:hypothetical protein
LLVGPDRIETDVKASAAWTPAHARRSQPIPVSCARAQWPHGPPISSLYWNAYALNTTA